MFTSTRLFLLVPLAVLVATGCDDAPTEPQELDPSFSRVTEGATFDWTAPARFGMDRNGDGLIDYAGTTEEINPLSWPVDLDACEHAGVRYDWFVDHRPVASVSTCAYRHEFATLGTYSVRLLVHRQSGPPVRIEQVVTVQDWLIVSLGDSYASGEGAPEVAQANPALIRSIEELLANMQAAQANRDAALAHFADVFEQKGLWDDILATAQQRRAAFRANCHNIENWSDAVDCATFLRDRALSFELYNQAEEHFETAVGNATERVQSLADALAAAQLALDATQNAILNLQAALNAARSGFTPPRWQEPYDGETWMAACHRSANAAPAVAALALEQSDPRTSVTFVHLACTGAQIDHHPGQLMADQLPTAERLVGDREIDALLVSIGGNDAGFANFAIACGIQEHCFDDAPAFNPGQWTNLCAVLDFIQLGDGCLDALEGISVSAKKLLADGIATLEGRYAKLATGFSGLTGLLEPQPGGPGKDGRGRPAPPRDAAERVRAGRVYISEYVDMTRGSNGAYCIFNPDNLLGTMPGFTVPEKQWLDITAAQGINREVQRAAAAHGWNYVSGIYSAYATHGYCAQQPWVVRAHETFLIQGDKQGVAHPNVLGHLHNGQAIHSALRADLYPAALGGAPRAPDQPLTRGVFAGPQR